MSLLPLSAFNCHENRGRGDTAGHHATDVSDNLGSLANRAETPSIPPITVPANPRPRRDKCFYLEPITFQVGNTLFRVPKTGFQVPGTVFEAMFSLPSNETKEIAEGSNDDNPIHLHGIDESKFRAFLTVLYPSTSQDVTVDEESQYRTLIGALDLATFWEFTKLRKEIISNLSPMITTRNDLEIIFISRKYRVVDWLCACYKKLAWSSSELLIKSLLSPPFSLDWETIAKIYHIRDLISRSGANSNTKCGECGEGSGPSSIGPNRFCCSCRAVKMIETHFREEFLAMEENLADFLEPPALAA
ncbi:hypothetical protein HYPSUDRAFT_211367 [Hypholoma sublateritium FD-334 SS-4]|uniref:BTB domain-containing protein n=1 Tax=Hypholoma sublateritium (strain FD-334 SS-4) TaxID=945553 RepID=A0A0D2QAR8_HYPSF|nr:hypothetical protein HYPSUDRAFT_211367 [Hypholoma sublateritium FD-334 SS-4]